MARKRRSTLGPFPKTHRWRELVEQYLNPKDVTAASDELLDQLKRQCEAFAEAEAAIRAAVFLVSLPICSRKADPASAMLNEYGIELNGEPTVEKLNRALSAFVKNPSPALDACAMAISTWIEREAAKERLLDPDPWAVWRAADGSAFCDLGREFFTQLNRICFSQALNQTESKEDIDLFAEEMSLITRTFSARWFNALARSRTPDRGSIRWYLAHCLGKLDLELCRERSDWVEEPRIWKSRQPRLFDMAS
jgi:hypothetical protein